ncbi:MerR family transcriptional regulator [Brucepastera parasyntrophica]|uniref:MerR family transcriptional regulator n=1 Tax=Brucepastera parasyntrophica TaxID=2880008 RepID=UPI00210A1DAB|nr:MerR family transcriptional regulator [Brucepastera parasyntrophica]ULQ58472.1 MerR family transcriptional regulator [Brucepastera parasyntrophica]
MAEFSIGQVEKITGVKAHVLRYWEEVIPLIRPRKDGQGRRFYSRRTVELISRIQFLVQKKKYTIEGAGEQLLTELTDSRALQIREGIDAIRSELLDMYAIAHKWNTENEPEPEIQ